MENITKMDSVGFTYMCGRYYQDLWGHTGISWDYNWNVVNPVSHTDSKRRSTWGWLESHLLVYHVASLEQI